MPADRFHERYKDAVLEDLPWYHPEPDTDLAELLQKEIHTTPSRVLDLGAGPAVHSIFLASRGHQILALDSVPEARTLALRLAAEEQVKLEYQTIDVLAWTPEQTYDVVFDRGFMHTCDTEELGRWREVVCRALAPDGLLVMKCFNVLPLRDSGPPGLSAQEVAEVLGPEEPGGLALHAMLRSRFPGVEPHATWTVTARKVAL